MPNTICKVCSKEFHIPPSWVKRKRGFYCSSKCYGISKKGKPSWNKGKKTGVIPKTAFKKGHRTWNKGTARKQFTSTNGYVFVLKPTHPFCDTHGYVKRSRLKMEKHLGRYLKPKEVVHHINGIKTDDRIINLELFLNHSKHMKFHMVLRYKH